MESATLSVGMKKNLRPLLLVLLLKTILMSSLIARSPLIRSMTAAVVRMSKQSQNQPESAIKRSSSKRSKRNKRSYVVYLTQM